MKVDRDLMKVMRTGRALNDQRFVAQLYRQQMQTAFVVFGCLTLCLIFLVITVGLNVFHV